MVSSTQHRFSIKTHNLYGVQKSTEKSTAVERLKKLIIISVSFVKTRPTLVYEVSSEKKYQRVYIWLRQAKLTTTTKKANVTQHFFFHLCVTIAKKKFLTFVSVSMFRNNIFFSIVCLKFFWFKFEIFYWVIIIFTAFYNIVILMKNLHQLRKIFQWIF